MQFGPVRCEACAATYPVDEGVIDVLAGAPDPTLVQRMMESPRVARAYERGVRSVVRDVTLRKRLDEATELLAVRSLAAPPRGEPLLDLSCGTGLHARELASLPGAGPVVGLDRSLAMLHEALHHNLETRLAVDLVRADAAELPARDGTFAVIVNVGAFHLYPDASRVLAEVARVLRPGGAFVCGTVLPDSLAVVRRVEQRSGVFRRTEAELRGACEAAGLVHFERLLLAPAILFRVERPRASGV